jgi:hypothetical protein
MGALLATSILVVNGRIIDISAGMEICQGTGKPLTQVEPTSQVSNISHQRKWHERAFSEATQHSQ